MFHPSIDTVEKNTNSTQEDGSSICTGASRECGHHHSRSFLGIVRNYGANKLNRRSLLLLIIFGGGFTYTHYPKQRKMGETAWTTFDSPSLLEHISQNHLTYPAEKSIPYNLTVSYKSWIEQEQFNKDILKIIFQHRGSKINGFFVEAGALDGQHLSHTLDLERFYGWTGLLVEASKSLVPQLKSKNRKSWIADVCLTDKLHQTVEFMTWENQSALSWHRGVGQVAELANMKTGLMTKSETPTDGFSQPKNHSKLPIGFTSEGMVDCFSLYSLLKAIPNSPKIVDLLVLDIEGKEYKVLKTYPFSLLPIKVIAVEHVHAPEGPERMIALMIRKGYKLVYRTVSDLVFSLNS